MRSHLILGVLLCLLVGALPRSSIVTVSTSADLQAALNAAQPGDTILVNDGAYQGSFIARTSGTETQPITLKAVHTGMAVIKGTGDPATSQDGLTLRGASWWIVNGLKAVGCAKGFFISSASHVTLLRLSSQRCTKQGLLAGGSNFLLMDGGDFGYAQASDSFSGTGCYIAHDCQYATVKHLNCHDNQNCGLQVNGEGGAVIQGLQVSGLKSTGNGLHSDGTKTGAALNCLVTNNSVITNTTMSGNYAGGIALFKSSNAVIAGGSIAFDLGKGRACISAGNGSTGSYSNMTLTPGAPNHVTQVGTGCTLTDAGGNVVVTPSTGGGF